MIKLLYITNGINGAGGLERVLSVKASYLAEYYDYEVTILTLNETHPNSFYEFSSKVKLLSISVSGNPLRYLYSYIKKIREVVKEIKPTVISVCDDGLKGFFVPIILHTKIPIIYERHVSKEIALQAELSFAKKNVINVMWRLMDYLASDFSKFVLLTNGNLNEWKTLKNSIVLPNPLSFYPDTSSSLNNKKVIAVGKQSYQKGYDLLLKAWAQVIKQAPDWELEIYGKRQENTKLEVLAEMLNIKKTVKFFEPEKNIQEKYLDASVYVMSSRYEGFGMVLIEAMACGVPCVSFDCPSGPKDIIKNGVDGFLVEKVNIEALKEKLIILMENEALRKQMGLKARENVKRYLPENIMVQWDELFNELVKNKK